MKCVRPKCVVILTTKPEDDLKQAEVKTIERKGTGTVAQQVSSG